MALVFMCGRYGLTAAAEDYVDIFHTGEVTNPGEKRYDVRPTQNAPVVVWQNGPKIRSIRWGYKPPWAKILIINTKSENMLTSPYAKNAVLKKRCIVPVSYFYEWQDDNGKVVPWKISPNEGPLFGLAGLLFSQNSPDTGATSEVFSIITTSANELMKKIHNRGKTPFRQPAILSPSQYNTWLDPSISSSADLERFSFDYGAEHMKAVALSKIGDDGKKTPPEEIT